VPPHQQHVSYLTETTVIMEGLLLPFDTHCCHTGTAIKHLVPDLVMPSFVFFDIHLSIRVHGCQKLQMTA